MIEKNKNTFIVTLLLCAILLPYIAYLIAADIEDKVFDPQLAAIVWFLVVLIGLGSLSCVNIIAKKYYQFEAFRPIVLMASTLTLVAAGWIANGAWYNYYFFSDYVKSEFIVDQHSSYPNQFIFNGKLIDGAANTTIRKILSSDNVDWDKPVTLEIHSNGGAPQEAMLISEFVKHYNINVEVVGRCISACTFILLSSKSRYIHPRAWIGFHATYMARHGEDPSYDDPSLTYYDEILAKHLDDVGANNDFKERAKVKNSKGGFFPEYQELKTAGIMNQNRRLYLANIEFPSYLSGAD
jgi:hypothetical protein